MTIVRDSRTSRHVRTLRPLECTERQHATLSIRHEGARARHTSLADVRSGLPEISTSRTRSLSGTRRTMSTSIAEIDAGTRFAFGENWRRFLSTLTDVKIDQA